MLTLQTLPLPIHRPRVILQRHLDGRQGRSHHATHRLTITPTGDSILGGTQHIDAPWTVTSEVSPTQYLPRLYLHQVKAEEYGKTVRGNTL